VTRPRVGISRCLLGDHVRYDGGHKRSDVILEACGPVVEWVPVCPEVEAGMPVPREPIELQHQPGGLRLIAGVSGRDWTDAMRVFAAGRVQALADAGISGYILKSGSPSCGLEGPGLFAQALLDLLPQLPIEDETRLHERDVRDRFLARVLGYRG
jgi:uncharacterized protein YbbK (DUF523 family)